MIGRAMWHMKKNTIEGVSNRYLFILISTRREGKSIEPERSLRRKVILYW